MAKPATYKIYTGSAWEELTFTPSSHTHSQYLTSTSNVYESYLTWGGKNFQASYGCIDAAMIPALGANRLAFMPAAGVTVEYSTNGGSTWSTYSVGDEGKINLFNGNGTSLYIGSSTATKIDKSAYMVRVTIETSTAQVYTVLNKFAILVSTGGSSGCYCTIDARTQTNYAAGTNTWVTFANKVAIGGWSGWNIINTTGITTYGNTVSQYRQVRFTFGVTSHANSVAYAGLCVMRILGFGGVGWTTPSTMAATGNIFAYDYAQNVTFPAAVKATTFYENGTALSSLYQAKGSYAAASHSHSGYAVLDGNNAFTGEIEAGSIYSCSTIFAEGNITTDSNLYATTIYENGTALSSKYLTSIPTATSSALGGIKLGYTAGIVSGTSYSAPVNVDSNGKAYVTIPKSGITGALGYTPPSTNTTYSTATSSALGLVKIGYSENGKNYPVELNSSGQMFVNVPWTDTNTTYDLSSYVTLTGSQALTNKTYNGYTLAAACAKGVTDSTSASALSTGSNLVTERDVYYGLASINGSRQTSSVGIYAPTSIGSGGQVLFATGTGAPVWKDESSMIVGTASYANDADTLDGCHAIYFAPNDHDHDETYAALSHAHTWSEITDKPSSFTPSSHTHDRIYRLDTRSLNPAPYASNDYPGYVTWHLKTNSVIGVSGEGTYSGLLELSPWGDSSGGAAHQLAFGTSGGIYHRYGTSSYSAWKKLATTSDIPTNYLTSHLYRPIQVNGTQILANSSNSALNLKAGNNVTITNSNGTVTISASGGSGGSSGTVTDITNYVNDDCVYSGDASAGETLNDNAYILDEVGPWDVKSGDKIKIYLDAGNDYPSQQIGVVTIELTEAYDHDERRFMGRGSFITLRGTYSYQSLIVEFVADIYDGLASVVATVYALDNTASAARSSIYVRKIELITY